MTWHAFLTSSHHSLDPGKWEPKFPSPKQEVKFTHHVVTIWLLHCTCDLLYISSTWKPMNLQKQFFDIFCSLHSKCLAGTSENWVLQGSLVATPRCSTLSDVHVLCLSLDPHSRTRFCYCIPVTMHTACLPTDSETQGWFPQLHGNTETSTILGKKLAHTTGEHHGILQCRSGDWPQWQGEKDVMWNKVAAQPALSLITAHILDLHMKRRPITGQQSFIWHHFCHWQ